MIEIHCGGISFSAPEFSKVFVIPCVANYVCFCIPCLSSVCRDFVLPHVAIEVLLVVALLFFEVVGCAGGLTPPREAS